MAEEDECRHLINTKYGRCDICEKEEAARAPRPAVVYTDPKLVGSVTQAPAPASGRTVSGYGGKIATGWKLQYRSRWRRVYVMNYGNSGSAYIRVDGMELFLDTDTEHRIEAMRDG